MKRQDAGLGPLAAIIGLAALAGCASGAAPESTPAPAERPAAAAPAAAAPATATPPSLGPAPELTIPAVERATLPNGLELQVVRMPEVPLVRARLGIDAGARSDGNRPGL
ncbi:MAG TPA: hypothetical protein VF037_02185, partial [Gemmatimonadales bacterium]